MTDFTEKHVYCL